MARGPALRAARSRLAALLAVLTSLATWAPPARAQNAGAPGGSISGAVVDVDTRAPLAGALVTLQPEPAGVLPAPRGSSGLAVTALNAMTDEGGAYRFSGLVPGRYRVDAVRPGYRPYSVVVELRDAVASAVVLGLTVEPIALEPVRPVARREDPFPRARAAVAGPSASAPARLRPGAPLATDAQELTGEEVIEAITTGEPDLFRALQRLPGMSARSDFSAELWTRGAPWHETRVFFDGVPLFDPLHGLGTLSGVSPQAVGALWAYPGVHPVSLPEGAAGAIELRSRRGAGEGKLNGAADLSLLSAGGALDQRSPGGAVSWLVSARRSDLDWLARLVGKAAGQTDLLVPYDFWDGVARLDLRLAEGRSLELSGLRQGDHWRGDPAGSPPSGEGSWVNSVARVSLVTASERLSTRHTLAYSGRTGRVRSPAPVVPASYAGVFFPDAAPRTSSDLHYLALSGEWRSAAGRPAVWAGGYELSRQRAGYAGEKAIANPVMLADAGPWEPDSMAIASPPLRMLGLWGEATFTVGALALQPALRVEGGDAVSGGGRVRPAPRLVARYELTPRVALSAAGARTWQYAQSLAPAGLRRATLSSDDSWLVAGPDAPAVHADLLTAGVEAWLADWRLTANAYGRREQDVALPDPTPGLAFAPRPLFVTGRRFARGLELSVRRVAPAWNVFAGYSLAESKLDAAGRVFPSGADQRHALDASAMRRLLPGLRGGAAFTAATGAPYTPIVSEQIGVELVPRLGESNSARGQAYAALDLLLDWGGSLGGREVGAYLQLKNALGRDNGVTYVDSRPGCLLGWCGPRAILENRYERGLPRLPVIGVRARF